jgi:cytochrome c oxidase cbb3-type subunit 3
MSDFFSNGWSVYIAVATVAALVACGVLLLVASRRKVMAGDNTTGHVWDEDLRELNNPLPLWWVGLFVLTLLFALAYVFLYPGLGANPGAHNWSSAKAHAQEVQAAQQSMRPIYAAFSGVQAPELAKSPEAMAIGERLFSNHCVGCHGSDARGSKGFPNLTDRDWLHGGDPQAISVSIAKGRQGVMPPMAAAVGSAQDVRQLAHYVLSLSGSAHDQIAAQLGQPKFASCAACHGADGKGNAALGAPNLTDKVWLHGWGESAIVNIINQGKVNQMPAHDSRLSPEQVQVLTAYVWSLSQPASALGR